MSSRSVPDPDQPPIRPAPDMVGAAGTGSGLLGRNDYTKLLAGQAVSGLGDWMATTAFMALALDLTGSPTAVAGVLAVRLLPGIVAGPIATRVSSRWSAYRTMLAMDLLRAGAVAVIPFVSAIGWLYAWAFALEVASLVFLPARDASVPQIVPQGHLPAANGLILGSSYATIPLGAAAFSAVTAFGGDWIPLRDSYSLVFWVDAATFVISFALVSRITSLPGRRPVTEEVPQVRLRDALDIGIVRMVLPAAAAASLGLGALFSVGIVLVQDVLHASHAAFGLLIVAFGVGASLGVLVVQKRAGSPQLRWARDGISLAGLSIIAISVLPNLALAYLAAVTLGGSIAYGLVGGISYLQSALEGTDRVLAFTVFHIAIRLSLGVAALATGVAADIVPDVEVGGLGTVASARLVLAGAGALVVAATASIGIGAPAPVAGHGTSQNPLG